VLCGLGWVRAGHPPPHPPPQPPNPQSPIPKKCYYIFLLKKNLLVKIIIKISKIFKLIYKNERQR